MLTVYLVPKKDCSAILRNTTVFSTEREFLMIWFAKFLSKVYIYQNTLTFIKDAGGL